MAPTEPDGPVTPRHRGPRRADVPGTGPASADGPEPQIPALKPERSGSELSGSDPGRPEPGQQPAERKPERMTEHERWLLEQRPPHWG